ncbi:MAG: hypothetical protein POG24_07290 [Acidocella sp.]|nr:hypothetical protein [Acidocella sp.]
MEQKSLLANILARVTQTTTETITGFLPMIGSEYAGNLMVVGRAVNGWTDGISPGDLADVETRNNYVDVVYNSVTGNMPGECPMSWITTCWAQGEKYNTAGSPFWRVIRRVVGKLEITEVDDGNLKWPSHLIWSNLYKVSPANGGNPPMGLKKLQFAGCNDLLQWEIKTFRPHRLLFLTGYDWAAPFLQPYWHEVLNIPEYLEVKAIGHLQQDDCVTKCVVATHPQGKNESRWVEEVVNAFNLP